MSFVTVKSITKTYGASSVVRGVDLAIERGEFVSLLGPSGCGKTTVLRMIAGLETVTSGQINFDGEDVTHVSPSRRGVGMVFQAYALFPNMTVADNVAFGLKVAGRPADEIKARVAEMLGIVKLPALAPRYPYQLSGGQQQRVALARALAVSPRILLLDEPLSALDAKIRVALRDEIRAVQRTLGITTIFVTHDQEEALSMSDRVVVMNEGRIEQHGTPHEIYSQPKTRFVAGFVGTLTSLTAMVADAAAGLLTVNGQTLRTASLTAQAAGTPVALSIRPEAITLGEPQPDANRLAVRVTSVQFLGAILRIGASCGDQHMLFDMFNRAQRKPPAIGEDVTISFDPADMVVLAA